MFSTPCVILAGGKSSRMGSDKSLLPFGGFNTLCEYQISRLTSLFENIYVSTKENKFDFKINLILDKEDKIFSPMLALEKILSYFKNTHVFVLSVDIPFVSKKEIEKMFSKTTNHDIVIPKTPSNIHALCGFYHSSLAPICKELASQDKHKIKDFLKTQNTKYINFEDEYAFTNLNYFDEYEKYK